MGALLKAIGSYILVWWVLIFLNISVALSTILATVFAVIVYLPEKYPVNKVKQ